MNTVARNFFYYFSMSGCWAVCLLAFLCCRSSPAQNTNAFEFREGDRVVLLGDGLIEGEQANGYFEFYLTTQYPERNVTFRNLGWSAGPSSSPASAGTGMPGEGFERAKEQLTAIKPTVACLGYGMSSSFQGEPGLARFKAELEKSMESIQQVSGETQVRFILLSPIPHEKLLGPWPDRAPHNQQLALYTKAIEELAGKRGAVFVPFFDALDSGLDFPTTTPLTEDGISLTPYGYRRAAEVLVNSLKWRPRSWRIGITREGKIRGGTSGIQALLVEQKEDRARLVVQEDRLILPLMLEKGSPMPSSTPACRLQFLLKAGDYEFRIDGLAIKAVTDRDFGKGLEVLSGPHLDQAEELRQAILRKNALYFQRWRPQDKAFLSLFPSQAQGQHTNTPPQLDSLIQSQEQKIAQLCRPIKHTFEAIPLQTTNASPAGSLKQ